MLYRLTKRCDFSEPSSDITFMLSFLFLTACNAGHRDNNGGNGPVVGVGCTVCGVGYYAARGNNTCTACGPHKTTGRNPTAASVIECGQSKSPFFFFGTHLFNFGKYFIFAFAAAATHIYSVSHEHKFTDDWYISGCKPGYSGIETCTQCPINTFSPGHVAQCISCGDSSETDGPGSASATDCRELLSSLLFQK